MYGDPRGSYGVVYMRFGLCIGTLLLLLMKEISALEEIWQFLRLKKVSTRYYSTTTTNKGNHSPRGILAIFAFKKSQYLILLLIII